MGRAKLVKWLTPPEVKKTVGRLYLTDAYCHVLFLSVTAIFVRELRCVLPPTPTVEIRNKSPDFGA